MDLHLHNTLSREKERFAPLDPDRGVRMYVCGPTVYQRIHVGNARAFVVFDVLYRLLRHGYGADKVAYVRNITDIEDKIIAGAAEAGLTIEDLTERTTAQFQADVAALGCLPPTAEPRATDHVGDMVALIETLVDRGHAYAAEGHVLFHVPSMPAYGQLSGRDRDEQVAGARVEVAPYKRDPADFVLWKPSTGDQPGWDSPWGRGRPGWHIECSAMAERHLGVPFDIHGGGLDLVFPHHENEIAQTCCARGVGEMARFWLHNGFLDMRGEKMSKSLGNVVRVPDALKEAPAEVVRLTLLWAHYRQPADYTPSVLAEARHMLESLYGVLDRAGVRGKAEKGGEPHPMLVEALADDLNFPKARYVLRKLSRGIGRLSTADDRLAAAQRLRASAGLLGLLQSDPETFRKANHVEGQAYRELLKAGDLEDFSSLTSKVTEAGIKLRIDERAAARARKDFGAADAIRRELTDMGVILEDRPDGSTDWRRA